MSTITTRADAGIEDELDAQLRALQHEDGVREQL